MLQSLVLLRNYLPSKRLNPESGSADCFLIACSFKVTLGFAFDARVEVLTEFTSDPNDPSATAQACFTAAIVYACFLVFCGCQVKCL